MRLFVIENGLFHKTGHHYNAALGVRREADRRGIEARFYVHRRASEDIVASLGARAVFPFLPYARLSQDELCGPLDDLVDLGTQFAEACSALVEDGIGPDDIDFVLPNMDSKR